MKRQDREDRDLKIACEKAEAAHVDAAIAARDDDPEAMAEADRLGRVFDSIRERLCHSTVWQKLKDVDLTFQWRWRAKKIWPGADDAVLDREMALAVDALADELSRAGIEVSRVGATGLSVDGYFVERWGRPDLWEVAAIMRKFGLEG